MGYGTAEEEAWLFLSQAPLYENLSELTEHFARVLNVFGFDRYSVVSLKNALSTDIPHTLTRKGFEELDSHYWARRYHTDDPCVGRILNYTRPFAWSDENLKPATTKARQMWGEASELGMNEGFVVKAAGPNGESVMVRMATEACEFAVADRAVLESVAIVFVTVGLRLEEGLKTITTHGVLSRREAESLYWVREGKTDWEIGAILGISVPTVGKHIANAKVKLNASSRSKAAVRAAELGWLDCQW